MTETETRPAVQHVHWLNPVTYFVIVVALVLGVIGVKQTLEIGKVEAAVRSACQSANQTADVWNLLITQSIDAEQKSTTDSPAVQAQKIEALRQIRFPHTDCGEG